MTLYSHPKLEDWGEKVGWAWIYITARRLLSRAYTLAEAEDMMASRPASPVGHKRQKPSLELIETDRRILFMASLDSATSVFEKGDIQFLGAFKAEGVVWVVSKARRKHLEKLMTYTRGTVATMVATPVIMGNEPLAMLVIREAQQESRYQRIPRGWKETGRMIRWLTEEDNHAQRPTSPTQRT